MENDTTQFLRLTPEKRENTSFAAEKEFVKLKHWLVNYQQNILINS